MNVRLIFSLFLLNAFLLDPSQSHPKHLSHPHAITPRFAAIRSNKVNLHVGPGMQYPVEWVLVYKNLPVLIITEFEDWRRIKLYDGTVGWVHKSLLTSKKKMTLITTDTQLKIKPKKQSKTIATLCKGVVAEMLKHRNKWMKIQIRLDDHSKIFGWIPEEDLWNAPIN